MKRTLLRNVCLACDAVANPVTCGREPVLCSQVKWGPVLKAQTGVLPATAELAIAVRSSCQVAPSLVIVVTVHLRQSCLIGTGFRIYHTDHLCLSHGWACVWV